MNPPLAPSTDRLCLRTPPDLVAAIPALLGFHPSDSLVLIALDRGEGRRLVKFTLRTDLPGPESMPAELAALLADQDSTEVVVVVVGGGSSGGADEPPPYHVLVEELYAECDAVGVLIRTSLWVSRVAQGEPWRCYGECGCSGRLPDPAGTELAAATVAAGQVIYADRAELERIVVEGDPVALRRRSRLLDARIDEVSRGGGTEAPGGYSALALIERWVARAGAIAPRLADTDVVELCLALSDPVVRDICLGFALDGRAASAERLWTALLAEAPDPEAAEPAVLLAFCALVRRDGALAGVALERARRAWPGHRLSDLFDQAMRAGYRPEEIEQWFAEGAARASVLLRGRGSDR
jgi:hypothetical protein